jgi:hypothetical protein
MTSVDWRCRVVVDGPDHQRLVRKEDLRPVVVVLDGGLEGDSQENDQDECQDEPDETVKTWATVGHHR